MYLTAATAPWTAPRPAAAGTEPTYTTRQVARLTGVTERQLQLWDEGQIITPAKPNHQRQYTAADIAAVERARDLRNAGVPLRKLRTFLNWHFSSVQKITVPTIIHGILVVPK
jgi:DNA-binding transcriptional MerR regulator